MNTYKILTAAIAAAVVGGASAMAQLNYQNGDLLVAFGNGGAKDVIVDIGAISLYQSSSYTASFDLSSVLTSTFGSVSGSVYWAVLGVNDTSIGGNSSVSQTDPNTVWASKKRINPSVEGTTPYVSGDSDQQQLAVGDIYGIGINTVPGKAAAGLIVDYATGIEVVSTSVGTFTSLMASPNTGNIGGDWSWNTLNYGVGTSDLFQSNPGDHYSDKSTYLGSVSLDADGKLAVTTVPEPSTYAMVGGGLLALLAVRRRK